MVTVTSTKETFRLSIVKVQLVLCFAPETSYEGQPHAFVKDIESTRSGSVQGQAWEQMLEFLKKNLSKVELHKNLARIWLMSNLLIGDII